MIELLVVGGIVAVVLAGVALLLSMYALGESGDAVRVAQSGAVGPAGPPGPPGPMGPACFCGCTTVSVCERCATGETCPVHDREGTL